MRGHQCKKEVGNHGQLWIKIEGDCTYWGWKVVWADAEQIGKLPTFHSMRAGNNPALICLTENLMKFYDWHSTRLDDRMQNLSGTNRTQLIHITCKLFPVNMPQGNIL